MTMNHRGNVTPMHNRMQDELVDILERKYKGAKVEGRRKKKTSVHKEWHVPNQQGGEFIIDVADLTDFPPIYYEIEERHSKKIDAYRKAFAGGTGRDVVVMYVSEMRRKFGENPRVNDLRAWILERVI